MLSTSRFVAIKILTAYATQLQGEIYQELKVLQDIRSKSAHPGSSHLPILFDSFRLVSHHGEHVCFVTDVLGNTLLSVRDILRPFRAGGGFPMHLVKKITSQCLTALEFLHDQCGIIHSGKCSHLAFFYTDAKTISFRYQTR